MGQSQRDVHDLVETYQQTIHELSQNLQECLEAKNYHLRLMTERHYKTEAPQVYEGDPLINNPKSFLKLVNKLNEVTSTLFRTNFNLMTNFNEKHREKRSRSVGPSQKVAGNVSEAE